MISVTVALRFLLVSLPSWTLAGVAHLLLAIIGLVVIPWQAGNVEDRDSSQFPGRKVLQFKAAWMWPWNNPEDGIDGLRGGDDAQAWWGIQTASDSQAQRIFRWSALRNPANSLRYVPVLSPKFRPEKIGFVGTGDEPPDGESGWAYTWQGAYSGLYVKGPKVFFWLGWKFRPTDTHALDPHDTRLPRADFALQLQAVHS